MNGRKIIDGLKDAIEGRGTTRVVNVKMTREQLAYEHAKSVGWNEAVRACAKIATSHNGISPRDSRDIATKIRELDRSVQAIDD